jgi:hypothetical protein
MFGPETNHDFVAKLVLARPEQPQERPRGDKRNFLGDHVPRRVDRSLYIHRFRPRLAGDRLWGFVGAAFLAGIALGIRHKSRAAAVAGFALYIARRAWSWMASGYPGSIIVSILVGLALWHGGRGTFAFHRFAPIAAGTPGIEDSFRSFGQSPKRTQQESERK